MKPIVDPDTLTRLPAQLVIQTGKMMATLKPDGTVEFGPDYDPDETARAFWEGLAERNPVLDQVNDLRRQLDAANARARRAQEREIATAAQLPPLWSRLRALEESARDLAANDDLPAILASEAGYARWVRQRDTLFTLLREAK